MIRGGPKGNFLRTLAIATIAIAAPAVVHSADFSLSGTQVTMTGSIVPGDSEKFTDTVGSKLVRTIVLDSKGGDIVEALDIGEKLHRRDVYTTVGSDGLCASACALIWAAGTQRSIANGGRVGFHGVYTKEDRQPTSVGNALVGAYLVKLGYDYDAVIYATIAPPTEMKWLDVYAAKDTGFTYEAKNMVETRAVPAPLHGCAKAAAQVAEIFGSTKGFSCKE